MPPLPPLSSGMLTPVEQAFLPVPIENQNRNFAEHLGSIEPGKLADMVILSSDIFAIKPEAIRNVKVETTIVGGRVVYRAPNP